MCRRGNRPRQRPTPTITSGGDPPIRAAIRVTLGANQQPDNEGVDNSGDESVINFQIWRDTHPV